MPAIGQFISFVIKVQNLFVFLQSAGAQQYLANPTLLDELTYKLPIGRKIDWAKYAAQIERPTVIDFSNWIEEAANVFCTISDTMLCQPDSKRKPVLRTNVSLEIKFKRCQLCGKDHKIYKCAKCIEKSVHDR